VPPGLGTPKLSPLPCLCRGRDGGLWPMAEATAASRGVRLQAANLPASSTFVNPDSAHHGPRREPLDAADVPRPSICRAAAPGPMPRGREVSTFFNLTIWRFGWRQNCQVFSRAIWAQGRTRHGSVLIRTLPGLQSLYRPFRECLHFLGLCAMCTATNFEIARVTTSMASCSEMLAVS
jgi:hypothetical protein